MDAGLKYTVYMYTFPNGLIYIGTTKNSIKIRQQNGYQHNDRMKKAIHEYGWNAVICTELESGLTREAAFDIEKYYIKKYDSTNPNIGYNISYGGNQTYAGLRHTDEYKERMSRLYKGKKKSESAIQSFRKSHEKEKKPVICRSTETDEVKEFGSLHDAADSVNGYPSNISRACKSGKPYKSYYWRFKEVVLGETLWRYHED